MKIIMMIGCWIFFLQSGRALSQPDFINATKQNGIVFFQDVNDKSLFYYLPGDVEIGKDSDGKPDFNFIMMRYTGTAVYNNNEQSHHFRNILTMRMVMKPQQQDSLRHAKATLSRQSRNNVQIKPLPISQLEAMLVFTPVKDNTTADTVIIRKGDMASENGGGYSTSGTYWQERYFTVFLDNYSAMILKEALNQNLSALSFMYAFYAKGISEKRELEFSGYGQLSEVLKKQLSSLTDSSINKSELRECIVKSNAFAIYLDTSKYSGLIKQIDINDAVPPGYAVLNIRNYDFANNLRSDLYEKTVELEATGAGGNKVNLITRFNVKYPDITSTNFRFKYAVRLDKPYRYRITEILRDGREIISEWKTISAWSNLLDVTTKTQ